jgi:hypothetical protein
MTARSAGLKTGAIAGVLSLVAMGAGHLYLGRIRRFLIPLVVVSSYVAIASALGLLSTPSGYVVLWGLMFALPAFAIIDSIAVAIRSGRKLSSWYARWRYVALWFIALALVAISWPTLREELLGFATYRMPAPTMKPTILAGDFVLANTRLPSGDVPVGAIVVVRHPQVPALFVRRVKSRSDGGAYELVNDWTWGMRDPALESLPRENIVGCVTTILWSPERGEFLLTPE